MLPLGVSIVMGLGMMGLTVAKRDGPARTRSRASGVQSATVTPSPEIRPIAGPVTYVDTSAIIDGRVVDVVASGFLYGTLVVPRFVLGELQHIADDAETGPARHAVAVASRSCPSSRRTTAWRSS